MNDEVLFPEERVNILRKVFKKDGLAACIDNAVNDDEIRLCKTFEIHRLAGIIEYRTTIKQGSIYDELKELEKILKSMEDGGLKKMPICRIDKDPRDITHDEWVKLVKRCKEDSVPVNEQERFWTVGEPAYYIPKKKDSLVDDIDYVIKLNRSRKTYSLDPSYEQKVIDDLKSYKALLKE